jgi:hypothetical protein
MELISDSPEILHCLGAKRTRTRVPAFLSMAVKISQAILILFALAAPAVAQTPPPQPGGVLANPDAPSLPPPTNPSGVPPLPTIIPSTILTPGSGH